MRNIAIIIVFVGCIGTTYCQTVTGTVYDQSNNSLLSDAAVYINGTSIGTISDIDGHFILNVSNYSSLPITISLLGYYSTTLSDYHSNKTYKIYLSPKTTVLNEIILTGKNKNWKKYFKIFKKEFLGQTKNAMACKILNEDALRFSFDPKNKTLEAFALQPIIIHNNSLAYTITYYLDKFKYKREEEEKPGYIENYRRKSEVSENLIILGNYLFKDELLTLSEPEQKKVEDRRRSAYLGSRMHFFRLLHHGNLLQKGKHSVLLTDFTLSSNAYIIRSDKTIDSDSLVCCKDAVSGYFKKSGEFSVQYQGNKTKITVKKDSVQFQRNGYFDPIEILFDGAMSKQRIGDLLPFEYALKQ